MHPLSIPTEPCSYIEPTQKSYSATPSQSHRHHAHADSANVSIVDVSTIPPRVLNSFFLWKKHHSKVLAASRTQGPTSSKEWSLAWKALPQSERDYWQEQFRENNAAFKAANPGYSYGAVKGLKKQAKKARARHPSHCQAPDNRETPRASGETTPAIKRSSSHVPLSLREGTPTQQSVIQHTLVAKRKGERQHSAHIPPLSPKPGLVRDDSFFTHDNVGDGLSSKKMLCGSLVLTPLNSFMGTYPDGVARTLSCPSIPKPVISPFTSLFRECIEEEDF